MRLPLSRESLCGLALQKIAYLQKLELVLRTALAIV